MIAESSVREKRAAICLSCDKLRHGIVFQCGLCGCVIKGKISLKREKCPAGKW
jgi:hypothetical protein